MEAELIEYEDMLYKSFADMPSPLPIVLSCDEDLIHESFNSGFAFDDNYFPKSFFTFDIISQLFWIAGNLSAYEPPDSLFDSIQRTYQLNRYEAKGLLLKLDHIDIADQAVLNELIEEAQEEGIAGVILPEGYPKGRRVLLLKSYPIKRLVSQTKITLQFDRREKLFFFDSPDLKLPHKIIHASEL